MPELNSRTPSEIRGPGKHASHVGTEFKADKDFVHPHVGAGTPGLAVGATVNPANAQLLADQMSFKAKAEAKDVHDVKGMMPADEYFMQGGESFRGQGMLPETQLYHGKKVVK